MAKSEFIGLVYCPICGNDEATVHEQASGTKKGRRYYRCYTERNGTRQRCGTIQCIGEYGQKYINENMRAIGQPEKAPEPIGQIETPEIEPEKVRSVPIVPVTPTPPKKNSLLGNFLASMSEGGDE